MKIVLAAAAIFLSVALTGCTLSVNGKAVNISDRPAVGLTLEHDRTQKIQLASQSSVSVELADGNIKLTTWDNNYIEADIREKLTAPSTREELEKLSGQYKVEFTEGQDEIKLEEKQPEKPRILSRYAVDVEMRVPQSIKYLEIKAATGNIEVSGFHKTSLVNLTLSSGSISLTDSTAYKYNISLDKGTFFAGKLEGMSDIKAGKANVQLEGIKGDIDYNSISGDLLIKGANSKLKCNLSEGRVDIKDSFLKADSFVYSTNGSVSAQLSGLDGKGKYVFDAISGAVKLQMPSDTGFVLSAKTDKGSIITDFKIAGESPAAGKSETGPKEKVGSGMALEGSSGVGGPEITIAAFNGDIAIDKNVK